MISINNYQKRRFIDSIVASLFHTVTNKKLAVFGFSYKKDTGDTRDAPAWTIVSELLNEGALVTVYDPLVEPEQIDSDIRKFITKPAIMKHLLTTKDPYAACEGAHAVVVCTEWEQFKMVDYQKIYSVMHKPAHVFDGRLLLETGDLQAIGFDVHVIGKSNAA